jgi:hypothetical protein
MPLLPGLGIDSSSVLATRPATYVLDLVTDYMQVCVWAGGACELDVVFSSFLTRCIGLPGDKLRRGVLLVALLTVPTDHRFYA